VYCSRVVTIDHVGQGLLSTESSTIYYLVIGASFMCYLGNRLLVKLVTLDINETSDAFEWYNYKPLIMTCRTWWVLSLNLCIHWLSVSHWLLIRSTTCSVWTVFERAGGGVRGGGVYLLTVCPQSASFFHRRCCWFIGVHCACMLVVVLYRSRSLFNICQPFSEITQPCYNICKPKYI